MKDTNINGFTRNQKIAYELLQSGENVFLTGDAGTGKSYVLNKFIESNKAKNILICAPSGIAAINVGGVTIHRAFGAPVTALPEFKSIPKTLKAANIVIIDEISMCRMDLFDFVGKCVFEAQREYKKKIQMVVVGDFYQLPPVLKDDEREVLNHHYGFDVKDAFAFQSMYWSKFNFQTIRLDEVVRQSDPGFVCALNQARIGDTACIDYIQSNCSHKRLTKAITICGTNQKAATINLNKLNAIKKLSRIYKSIVSGSISNSDKVTDDILTLKESARVMMLTNDKDGRWYNGSLGSVTAMYDDSIVVMLDNGPIVNVNYHKWAIEKYAVKKDGHGKVKLEKEVVGTFSQLPIKLAYAITIHKSQGQTYDAVNLHPYSWAHGQLYVGLSRVKSIDKLYLEEPISERYLVVSDDVINYFGYDNVNNVIDKKTKLNKTQKKKRMNKPEKKIIETNEVELKKEDNQKVVVSKYDALFEELFATLNELKK